MYIVQAVMQGTSEKQFHDPPKEYLGREQS